MAILTLEEQDSRQYLVFQQEDIDIIDTMILGMLDNNKIEGTVPFSKTQLNAQICYRYDITGLISVAEYFGTLVSKKMLFTVLEGIIFNRGILQEYMLGLSDTILDAQYMYLDPATEKVKLLLLPIKQEQMTLEQFFKSLIFSVQYNQCEDCSYIASLLSYFNGQERFSIAGFAEMISHLKNNTANPTMQSPKNAGRVGVQYVQDITDSGKNLLAEERNVGGQKAKTDANSSYQSGYPAQTAETVDGDNGTTILNPQIDSIYAGQKFVNPNLQKNIEDRKKNSSYPSQMAPKTYPGTMSPGSEFNGQQPEIPDNSGNTAPTKEKKGLFGKKDKVEKEKKSLFGKKEKQDKNSKQNNDNPPKKATSFMGIAIPGSDVVKQEEGVSGNGSTGAIPAQNVDINVHAVPIQDFGETMDLRTYTMETSLLESESSVSPYLFRKSTGEQFFLTKEITKIGRSRKNVDIYITDNTSIGRLHAIFFWKNGRVIIEDQNSTNGTYVNGEKVSGQRELTSGCCIRLSNEEFEFHMS